MIMIPDSRNPEYEIELEDGHFNWYPIKKRVLKDGTIKFSRDKSHAKYGIHTIEEKKDIRYGLARCVKQIYEHMLERQYYKITGKNESIKRTKIKETTLREFVKTADELLDRIKEQLSMQSLLQLNQIIN